MLSDLLENLTELMIVSYILLRKFRLNLEHLNVLDIKKIRKGVFKTDGVACLAWPPKQAKFNTLIDTS